MIGAKSAMDEIGKQEIDKETKEIKSLKIRNLPSKNHTNIFCIAKKSYQAII